MLNVARNVAHRATSGVVSRLHSSYLCVSPPSFVTVSTVLPEDPPSEQAETDAERGETDAEQAETDVEWADSDVECASAADVVPVPNRLSSVSHNTEVRSVRSVRSARSVRSEMSIVPEMLKKFALYWEQQVLRHFA